MLDCGGGCGRMPPGSEAHSRGQAGLRYGADEEGKLVMQDMAAAATPSCLFSESMAVLCVSSARKKRDVICA